MAIFVPEAGLVTLNWSGSRLEQSQHTRAMSWNHFTGQEWLSRGAIAPENGLLWSVMAPLSSFWDIFGVIGPPLSILDQRNGSMTLPGCALTCSNLVPPVWIHKTGSWPQNGIFGHLEPL